MFESSLLILAIGILAVIALWAVFRTGSRQPDIAERLQPHVEPFLVCAHAWLSDVRMQVRCVYDAHIAECLHRLTRHCGIADAELMAAPPETWRWIILGNPLAQDIIRTRWSGSVRKEYYGLEKFSRQVTYFVSNWLLAALLYDATHPDPYWMLRLTHDAELISASVLMQQRFIEHPNFVKALVLATKQPKNGDAPVKIASGSEMRIIMSNISKDWLADNVAGRSVDECYDAIQQLRTKS